METTVKRYYEVGMSFSVPNNGEVCCWQKDVTETINAGGLGVPVGVARRSLDERKDVQIWVTFERLEVPATEDEKVTAAKARALGMLRIFRRAPYGDMELHELCIRKMSEFVADGMMDKEENKKEEEDGSNDGKDDEG